MSTLCRSQRAIRLTSCTDISLSECRNKILFLRDVFDTTSPRIQDRKVAVMEDTEGANEVANYPGSFARWKHIHARYHFIQIEIREGNISVVYVKPSDQCVDMMTKELPQDVFKLQCRLSRNLIGACQKG